MPELLSVARAVSLGLAVVAALAICGCAGLESLEFASWEFLDGEQSIRTAEDVVARRAEMVQLVFGAPMPTRSVDEVEEIHDAAFDAYQIEQITVTTDDLTSIVYLIHPAVWEGTLAIYHQGHGGDFRTLGERTIKGLLEDGHQVLALSMPMLGLNTHPFLVPEHELLANRPHPLRYFIEPVVVALNWAQQEYAYVHRFMVGLSGGGWTTVVVAGIDERIDASYPVAGSWPHYVRERFGSLGDWEQRIVPSYLELYLMATHPNRSQTQVFNEFDSGCFGGLVAYDYLSYVSYLANGWSGTFEVLIDRDQECHEISEYTLAEIRQRERPTF